MPIADLFSAPAIQNPVGTCRDSRDSQQRRAIGVSRHGEAGVGTVGTRTLAQSPVPTCPDVRAELSGQEMPNISGLVPIVPTVPTTNCDPASRCRTCSKELYWPKADAVVFADGTAECMRCCDDEVERLLAAGHRAANPDLATDPAETMIRGEVR